MMPSPRLLRSLSSLWGNNSFNEREEASLEAQKRHYITRASAVFLVALGPLFLITNLIGGNYPLAGINLLTSLVGLSCLVLNRCGFYYGASLVLSIPLPPLFFCSALLFGNGMEYTLLLLMMGAVFMFNSRPLRVAFCLMNGIGFLAIRILLFNPVEPALPLGRFAVNISVFLISYYWILELFRSININYQKTIIEKNQHLQNLTRELEAANVSKEKIFRIVSHDLRGPLGNLHSTLELVGSHDLSREDFREMLPTLLSELQSARTCLDTLLNWSSGQLEHLQPSIGPVALHEVWRDTRGQLAELYERKGIVLRSELPESAVVRADRDILSIIIRNLLSNALKFTAKGGSVTLKSEASGGGWTVSVSDTGVGMPPKQLDSLLSSAAFQSTRGTEGEHGLGLGLRICSELLHTLGTQLHINSIEGSGSSFYFSLEGAELPNTPLAQAVERVQ